MPASRRLRPHPYAQPGTLLLGRPPTHERHAMRRPPAPSPRNSCGRLLFVRYGRLAAMEVEMSRMWRRFRIVVAMVLTCAVGSLPACGTMGGGGMRYLVEPPSEVSDYIAT